MKDSLIRFKQPIELELKHKQIFENLLKITLS